MHHGVAAETGYGVATTVAPVLGPETGGLEDGIGDAAGAFVNWLSGADKKRERASKNELKAAELELQAQREAQAFQLQVLQAQQQAGGSAQGRTILGMSPMVAGVGALALGVALWLVLKD